MDVAVSAGEAMPERVRIALIGAGRIGQRHAATLAAAIPRAELAVIADVQGPAAEAMAARVRCERWTDDPSNVLADPAIDAVVIASSTDSHAPLIVGCGGSGQSSLLREADRARPAGDRPRFGRRRDGRRPPADGLSASLRQGVTPKAKEMIDSGALGRIEAIRDTMRDPGPPPRPIWRPPAASTAT